MESHWPHRTAKRSLFSLAVSNGGSICLWYLYVYIFTGIFLHFLISWLFQISNGLSLTTLNSTEISLCSGSFEWGVHLPLVFICLYMHWYFLIFSYKLTVSNGLPLTTLNSGRDHSVLWQFQMGGGHHLTFSHQLTVLNGFSLMVWMHTELTHFHWQFCGGDIS